MMKYYGIYPQNDFRYYLQHHGIPGQKWGIQHGPPYPLSREVNLEIRKNCTHEKKETSLDSDEWFTVRNSKLLSNGPKIEKLSDLDLKKNSSISHSFRKELEKDLMAVNPRSSHDNTIGSIFICRNCSTAFELRRRGYDVEARRRDDGSNAGGAEKYFKNGKFSTLNIDFENKEIFKMSMEEYKKNGKYDYLDAAKKSRVKAYKSLCKELTKQGDGARGILVIGWVIDARDLTKRTSYFHALNYAVIEGSVEFYDSQSASKGADHAYGFSYRYVDPRDYSYMRTDNLELSKEVTKAVVSKSKSDRR